MAMPISPWFLLLLLALRGRGGTGGGGVGLPGTPTGGNGNGAGGLKGLPALPKPTAPRPPGDPLGRDCDGGEYNESYWPTQASVKGTFAMLGYPVPNRPTMNELGPDGSIGGGDDVPNPVVMQFQDDYNAMSDRGVLGNMAGGLRTDGFVGPCVLNGLENVLMHFDGTDWADALAAVVTGPGG